MSIEKLESASGIPIYVEPIESLHSATVGVWFKVGSRHEDRAEEGMSHLVEHMLFKGTLRRGSRDISEALEHVGGEINAFTSREYTCLWARAPHDHVDLALDMLFDQVAHSIFDIDEFRREKKVILDEVRMYEDSPEEVCSDELARVAFDGRLGHPITGRASRIRRYTRDQVYRYYRSRYGPGSMFITVIGRATPDQVIEKSKLLDQNNWATVSRPEPFSVVSMNAGVRALRRPLEQTHYCLAWEGLPSADQDRYVLHMINTYLGSGMSSRLFQRVRLDEGLAYGIHSFVQSYTGVGLFGVYSALDPANVPRVTQIIRDEVKSLVQDGIDDASIDRLKNQVRGGLMLSMEKPSFRMTRIGVCEINYGRLVDVDEVLDRILSITRDDVTRLCQRLLGQEPRVILTVGDLDGKRLNRSLTMAA